MRPARIPWTASYITPVQPPLHGRPSTTSKPPPAISRRHLPPDPDRRRWRAVHVSGSPGTSSVGGLCIRGWLTLIETAASIARNGGEPKPPIVLSAVTGEASGLLGSEYFVRDSTMPVGRIAANRARDGLLPLRSVFAHGSEESDLGDDMAAAATESAPEIPPDPERRDVPFVGSDPYRFIESGLPVLAPETGYRGRSPGM